MYVSIVTRVGKFVQTARCLSSRSQEEDRIVNLLQSTFSIRSVTETPAGNTDSKPWELLETKREKKRKRKNRKRTTAEVKIFHQKKFESEAFSEFRHLHTTLRDRLNYLYKETLEIQDKVLPLALQGRSVVFQSATGTGKTLAFTIPIINDVMKQRRTSKHTQYIILNPTRELCLQTYSVMTQLLPDMTKVLTLGVFQQKKEMISILDGVPIIIGTPGRLNDYIQNGFINLSHVQVIVVDECDRMFENQFFDQIEHIFKFASRGSLRQILLSSATIPESVTDVVSNYVPYVTTITCDVSPINLKHICCVVPRHRRTETLIYLLNQHCGESLAKEERKQIIVFVTRKEICLDLPKVLQDEGIQNIEVVHADLKASVRDQILKRFRDGRTNILITTDISARGLDIPECQLTIQIQPRGEDDMYLHRAGRAGRAGRAAHAYVIVVDKDKDDRKLIKTVRGLVDLEVVDARTFLSENASNISSMLENDTQHVDSEISFSLDVSIQHDDVAEFEAAIEELQLRPINQTHVRKKKVLGLWFTSPTVARAARSSLRLHYIKLGKIPPNMAVYRHAVNEFIGTDWDEFYSEIRRRKRIVESYKTKEQFKYYKFKKR